MSRYGGPKTCTRITWRDGSTTYVLKRGRWWHWRNERRQICESSHLSNVKYQAKAAGGVIDRVAHPDYIQHLNRPKQPGTGTDELRRLFRGWNL